MYVYDPPRAFESAIFSATLLHEDGGTPVVSAFGEIDLSTFHDLDILIMKAVSESVDGGGVVVDLRGVDFMDATGLRALINGRDILRNAPGGSLAVVCEGKIRRLFEIAGLTEDFELYQDLDSAVGGSSELRVGAYLAPTAGSEAIFEDSQRYSASSKRQMQPLFPSWSGKGSTSPPR